MAMSPGDKILTKTTQTMGITIKGETRVITMEINMTIVTNGTTIVINGETEALMRVTPMVETI